MASHAWSGMQAHGTRLKEHDQGDMQREESPRTCHTYLSLAPRPSTLTVHATLTRLVRDGITGGGSFNPRILCTIPYAPVCIPYHPSPTPLCRWHRVDVGFHGPFIIHRHEVVLVLYLACVPGTTWQGDRICYDIRGDRQIEKVRQRQSDAMHSQRKRTLWSH